MTANIFQVCVLFISFYSFRFGFGLVWSGHQQGVQWALQLVSLTQCLTPQVDRAVGVGAVGVRRGINAAGVGCSIGGGIDAASVGCCVRRGSYIGRGSAVGRKELGLGSGQSDDGEQAESELKESRWRGGERIKKSLKQPVKRLRREWKWVRGKRLQKNLSWFALRIDKERDNCVTSNSSQ